MESVVIQPTQSDIQEAHERPLARLKRHGTWSSLAFYPIACQIGLFVFVGAIAYLLLTLSKAQFPSNMNASLSVKAVLWLLFACLIGTVVFISLINTLYARAQFSVQGGGSEPYELVLETDKLSVKQKGRNWNMEWSVLEGIEIGESHSFIFTDVLHALPVMARCFASEADYNTFVNKIEANISDSRLAENLPKSEP